MYEVTYPVVASLVQLEIFSNLKNDILRRRYDALKYDLKKVEEVVYDLRIRGMIPAGGCDGQEIAS